MICDKCFHVDKNQTVDAHGNIHFAWQCKETYRLVFSQIIYSEKFLQQLRNGQLNMRSFREAGFLPENKPLSELGHLEVLHVRKSKTCKNFKFRSKPLTEFLK